MPRTIESSYNPAILPVKLSPFAYTPSGDAVFGKNTTKQNPTRPLVTHFMLKNERRNHCGVYISDHGYLESPYPMKGTALRTVDVRTTHT